MSRQAGADPYDLRSICLICSVCSAAFVPEFEESGFVMKYNMRNLGQVNISMNQMHGRLFTAIIYVITICL